MSRLRYYIDGYNVVHHVDGLREAASTDLDAARARLIEAVAQFCTGSGDQATIVFDGQGARISREHPIAGLERLEVVYTVRQRSADTVIEREVYDRKRPRDTAVVSADRAVRDFCMGLGIPVFSPEQFMTMVEDVAKSLTDGVRAASPKRDGTRLEDHLGDETISYLEAMKKRLRGK